MELHGLSNCFILTIKHIKRYDWYIVECGDIFKFDAPRNFIKIYTLFYESLAQEAEVETVSLSS